MTKVALAGMVAVLAIGALLRAWNFPSFHEVRDVDDIGYLSSGLVLWEGMVPGYHASPSGPQTWLVWLYAATKSGVYLIHPTPTIAGAPVQVRPMLAVDAALFDIYQDMAPLHRFILVTTFLISIGGIYGAYRLGWYYGGIWTGVLLGGLVAVFPLYIEFAACTRPYSDAWSFTLLSLYSAARPSRGLGAGRRPVSFLVLPSLRASK